MPNARSAQLLEQRRKALTFGNKLRVLSPANNAVATIAKQTATAELNAMVKKYNDGDVKNEDMKAFLLKAQNNPAISQADKVDIADKIRDFDTLIAKDKLEAVYKAAPDNSLQQLQAAKALSDFYTQRANSQAAGTPAQSQSLQNAGDWQGKVDAIQKNVNLLNQRNQRYVLEAKVNQIQSGSSEEAVAKAQMWKELYDTAVAQGDTTDANKYAASYQSEVQNAKEIAAREQETKNSEEIKAEKTAIRDYLGQLTNDYHDNKINEQQYLQALADISPRVDATNDYGLINTLNRTTDIIQKNLERGGLNRGTTAGGLPTVLGKGAGGGTVTSIDQENFNYSDSLYKLKKAYDGGSIDAKTYIESYGKAVVQHAQEVNNFMNTVEQIATTNPDSKVYYDGKKQRAADVLENLRNDYQDLVNQGDAIDSGHFALVQVGPSQFTSGGKIAKNGQGVATYKPIDTRNLPDGKYIMDSEGVYHEITPRSLQLKDAISQGLITAEQANSALQTGYYYAPDGTQHKVYKDSSGTVRFDTNEQYARIYDPGSSNYKDVILKGEKTVPSFADQQKQLDLQAQQATSPAALKLKAQNDANLKANAIKQAQTQQAQNPIEQAKNLGQKALTGFNALTNPVGASFEAVAPIVAPYAQKAVDAVSKVVAPVTPQYKSAEELNLPSNTPISLPKSNYPSSTNTTVAPVAMPTLRNEGQQQPNAIQQATASGQLKQQPIQGLQGLKTTPKVTPQSPTQFIQSKVNDLKNLASKILPFKF